MSILRRVYTTVSGVGPSQALPARFQQDSPFTPCAQCGEERDMNDLIHNFGFRDLCMKCGEARLRNGISKREE